MEQCGDQGAPEVPLFDARRCLSKGPVEHQFDQAQAGLQRVRDVVVGRVHWLEPGVPALEQVPDGIQVGVDVAVVRGSEQLLVPRLGQGADVCRVGKIDHR